MEEWIYQTILDTAGDVVWMYDVRENKFLYINNSVRKHSKFDPSDITGKSFRDVISPESYDEFINQLNDQIQKYKTNKSDKSYLHLFEIKLKDGTKQPIETLLTLIDDESGTLKYITGIDRELSLEKINEARIKKKYKKDLKRNQDLLNDMGSIAKIGGWQLDVLNWQVSWTDEMIHIFDLELNSGNTVETFLKHYTPESRKQMEKALLEAIRNGKPYDLELELISGKGAHKWIRSISKIITENGKVVELRGSVQDITERVQIENELRKAKEQAEESDRLKTVFLQNMSHEIRTPLNSIMGFAELLPENLSNPEKLKKFSDIIYERGTDLLELINDLLELSRIETKQMTLNISECNLLHLFNEIKDTFDGLQKKMNKNNIQLALPLNKEINPVLLTDKGKLKQILVNLLNNALKFTDSGIIEIGYCLGEDTVEFYVKDTGIGIPEEKINEIFKRFVQLNYPSGNLQSGTGLGLSIVKGLVEYMGGTIQVKSKLNEGSLFLFSLPVKIKPEETPETHVQTDIHQQEILLVEDDYFSAEYIKELFSGTKFKIYHVTTGKDAINFILSHPIHIFLVDIRLPDMEGYDVMKNIKTNHPDSIVIAETAYASQNDYEKAISSGFDDYISKPIKREYLMQKVYEHVK